MPLKRTPPTTPVLKSDLQTALQLNIDKSFCELEVGSPQIDEYSNVTQRSRRHSPIDIERQMSNFMSEMKAMLTEANQRQEKKLELIYTTIEEIKKQNSDIRMSLEFLSKRYEDLIEEFNDLKTNNLHNTEYIKTLEDKIEKMEHSSRSTCLEIKNIPVKKTESKVGLLNTVADVGNALKVSILPQDIKDIFRIGTKSPEVKTIIVDFTSILTKEKLLASYKNFNKGTTKLNTEHLKIGGLSKPIFISENLTAKMKRLFYLARVCANSNGYKYCWISKGKIFIREKEQGRLHLIREEHDLRKLEKQIL